MSNDTVTEMSEFDENHNDRFQLGLEKDRVQLADAGHFNLFMANYAWTTFLRALWFEIYTFLG